MRRAAGLTGDQLAKRLGWARTKVPKIENGRQMPTEQDISRWVEASGQPAETAAELLAMLSEGRAVHLQWKHQLRHGHATLQTEWDRLVRQATTVRNFEIVVIPGLLQTPDYARYRALAGVRNYGAAEEGIEQTVAARVRRQQVLYEPGRTFEFVITEAALRIGACPADAMTGQLDRLGVLSRLPNITLGIIPLGVTLPAMPQNPFMVLGDVVIAETHGSEITIGGDEANTYKRLADALMAEALTGDDARDLVTSAIEWWRVQPR